MVMVRVRVCVRVGGEERGGDAWDFFHEERSDDAVDGMGMGWFKVRQTPLVDRVGTLHKIWCTILSCTLLHKIRVSTHNIRVATKQLTLPLTVFLLLSGDMCITSYGPNVTVNVTCLKKNVTSSRVTFE